MSKKNSKLVKNSFIIAIGNMGSKSIAFIMLPLYTNYLTPSEYGTYDILQTTISLIVPLISLCMVESVVRYTLERNSDKKEVFTNSLVVSAIGFLTSLLFIPLFNNISIFNDFVTIFYILLFLNICMGIFKEFTRALGKMYLYVTSDVAHTVSFALFNIVFLVFFKMGLNGYLYSLILSILVDVLVLLFGAKLIKYISISKISKNVIKKFVIFSIPLIPNSLMWWVMGVSDRFILTYYWGVAFTGVYGIANKISSIITILNSIFLKAWQISAIEEYDTNEKSTFYSGVFLVFSAFMFMSVSGMLLIIKPLFEVLVADEFYIAWKYALFLIIGALFGSFSNFVGVTYSASSNTKGAFKTSLFAGLINIALNFLLIPTLGIQGASVATMISFGSMWIYRIYDTRKFIKIHFNKFILISSILIILCQSIVLLFNINIYTEIILNILLFLLIITINKKPFIKIVKKLFGKLLVFIKR